MVTVQGSRDPGQGSQVRESLDRVLRWTSRRANRLRLYGRAAELSQKEVWLLDAVDSAGQLRLSDLATWQGVDKSTITPQVRKLEGRGLRQRSSDATDRRAVRLVLTPRGRALQKRRAESGAALIDACCRTGRWRTASPSPATSFASPTSSTTTASRRRLLPLPDSSGSRLWRIPGTGRHRRPATDAWAWSVLPQWSRLGPADSTERREQPQRCRRIEGCLPLFQAWFIRCTSRMVIR